MINYKAWLVGIAFLGVYVGVALLFNNLHLYNKQLDQLATEHRQMNVLSKVVLSNTMIDTALTKLLVNNPKTTLARVSVIHERVSSVTMIPFLRFDHNNTVVPPGAGPTPPLMVDIPLSQWSDYMPAFMAGRCVYLVIADLTNTDARARLLASGIVASIGCPLTDKNGALFGAVYLCWEKMADVPTDLQPVIKETLDASILISSYFQSRIQ